MLCLEQKMNKREYKLDKNHKEKFYLKCLDFMIDKQLKMEPVIIQINYQQLIYSYIV